jgi:hypothetical protein
MLPSSKRRKTSGVEMKPKSSTSERKPLPVTILSGFLVCDSPQDPRNHIDIIREAGKRLYSDTSSSHRIMVGESPLS